MTEPTAKHDIFVSYAREDRERVRPIVTRLRAHGWRVWWDERLLPGDLYHDEILAAIEGSRGVLVVWSEHSVKKRWVREEAIAGQGRDAFVTIRIDDCAPPLGFKLYQAHLVSDGDGLDPTALDAVIRGFEKVLGPPARPARVAPARRTARSAPAASGAARAASPVDVVRGSRHRARWAFAAGALVVAAVAFLLVRIGLGEADVSAGLGAYGRMATPGAIEEDVHPTTGARYPKGWVVLDATQGDRGWATEVREPEIGVVFRLIPSGSFQMGSPKDEPGREKDETLHDVTLTWPFYMAVTEITRGQAARIDGKKAPDLDPTKPVRCNWELADRACTEMGWQLPTEAQWEYAARANGPGRLYWWGDDPDDGAGKANVLDESAAEAGAKARGRRFGFNDSHPMVASVGEYEPNRFGLYDMTGNYWEWCLDAFDGRDYGPAPAVDPENRARVGGRVLRGGSWISPLDRTRLAFRHGLLLTETSEESGFRPVLNLR